MTDNEAAILTALQQSAEEKTIRELGGSKGSHHSTTVARMAMKGWVLREVRGGGDVRPAFSVKITVRGEVALAAYTLSLKARRELAERKKAKALKKFGR